MYVGIIVFQMIREKKLQIYAFIYRVENVTTACFVNHPIHLKTYNWNVVLQHSISTTPPCRITPSRSATRCRIIVVSLARTTAPIRCTYKVQNTTYIYYPDQCVTVHTSYPLYWWRYHMIFITSLHKICCVVISLCLKIIFPEFYTPGKDIPGY